jgi:Protein of unknown function (DUF642)
MEALLMFPRLAAIVLIASLCSSTSRADFTNGSFEAGNYTFDGNGADSLQPGSTTITGWTTFGAELAVIENTNNFGLVTPFENNFLDLTGYHDSSPYGGVEQSVATVVGDTYQVSLYLGVDNDQGLNGYGPVSVQIAAGSSSTILTANSTGPGNIWTEEIFSFVADSTSTLVAIQGNSTASGHYIGLDNLSISPGVVPEPPSIVMLCAGCAMLTGFARRWM